MRNEDGDQTPGNSKATKAVILLAMALAAVVAIGGFIAVYKAAFVYSSQ
ncbi:hypothetical protein JNB88_26625 [Rhizobium cauense]|nr:hypothetical protein [Rhizobium cauense]MBW9117199.1 hypothetical protein [Rhizobium cauense]